MPIQNQGRAFLNLYGRAGAPGGPPGREPGLGNEPQLVLNMPNKAVSNTNPNTLFFMGWCF
jgi:hypothetical protein